MNIIKLIKTNLTDAEIKENNYYEKYSEVTSG